jgi:hypothetical protein
MHLLESAETCACEWHGCQTASGMLMSFIVAVCGVNQVTTEQKEQREREATTNERKKKLKGCRICVPAATSDFSWQRQEASQVTYLTMMRVTITKTRTTFIT